MYFCLIMEFKEFEFKPEIVEALSYMNFVEATPIQEKVIPIILEHHDLIACSQTGTGKTAAFVLPILSKLYESKTEGVKALIIVPTRELAIQIEQQIQGFSYFLNVGSVAVYGGGDGHDWEAQRKALINGADIVVATPGKLLSYLKMGQANFDNLNYLVLDEADRMLDMGFVDDINAIISFLPKKRQNLMFSATMPQNIRQLAKKLLVQPIEVAFSMSKPAEGVDQKVCYLNETDKISLLKSVIADRPTYDCILIFSSTKEKVGRIVRSLRQNGIPCEGISSNLEQNEREEVLGKFRAKQLRVLVATDVLSRGIDVKDINLVVNFDVPSDAEDYVHRVGRTARVNAKGEALTLVNADDLRKFKLVEKEIEMEVPKLEGYPYTLDTSRKTSSRNHAQPANSRTFHVKKRGSEKS